MVGRCLANFYYSFVVVITLEGGTADDLKVLDEPPKALEGKSSPTQGKKIFEMIYTSILIGLNSKRPNQVIESSGFLY